MSVEREIREWRETRWPKQGGPEWQDIWDAAKVAEEAGEVAGTVQKIAEGRAQLSDLAAELGDVLIACSTLADRHGWTLADLLDARWRDVRCR